MKKNKILAAESIDTGKAVHLSVSVVKDGTGISGVQFRAYRIADIDRTGAATLVSPFDKYNINLKERSGAKKDGIAAALEGFVLRDHVKATCTALTNQDGKAVFSNGTQMKQGLYLITAKRHTADGMAYTIQPTLVQLPAWDEVKQQWIYDVNLNAKYEAVPEAGEGSTISRKVLKVWESLSYDVTFPKEVTVQLLKDGEVFDKVILNKENNWGHTWEELDANHQWNVVEEEIEGYSVTTAREGITFVITNTYGPKPTEGYYEDESESEFESEDIEDSDDNPSSGGGKYSGGSTLPQTGQLWWPPAMMVCIGLLLIVIGLIRRRGN